MAHNLLTAGAAGSARALHAHSVGRASCAWDFLLDLDSLAHAAEHLQGSSTRVNRTRAPPTSLTGAEAYDLGFVPPFAVVRPSR